MKKIFITMLVVLTTCVCTHAQEKMKVELKNGNVVTYNVEDVNRFYFTTEAEEVYADYCEVEVEDETVMTTDAIFELDYDIDVEYVRYLFFKANAIKQLSNKQIVELINAELIKNNSASGQMNKDQNILLNNRLEEGTEYALACIGYNDNGQNGAPMVYCFKTKTASEEQIVHVVNAKYDDNYFYYDTEIDDEKVLEYYLLTEAGNNLERTVESPALIGYAWKQKIKENEKAAGQNYTGTSFKEQRTNGANSLRIFTWTRDFDLEFSGIIYENILSTNASSRHRAVVESIKACQNEVKTFSKEEIISCFQIKKIR